MNTENNLSVSFEQAPASGRHTSPPPPGLRQRPLMRAATLGDVTTPLNRRRSSMFSESFSESRRSLRESTDDLLHPRPTGDFRNGEQNDSPHWHSVPLILALLPALGGLVFKNGNALITDITLLCLAAVLLNWSTRLPWTWYQSARSIKVPEAEPMPSSFESVEEKSAEDGDTSENWTEAPTAPATESNQSKGHILNSSTSNKAAAAAEGELRIHELLALALCFISPMLGAWLLHAIRAQLSRRSEDLISNYNLTIFLLATEIRPLSHLVKMIQARTLFLQKVVTASLQEEAPQLDAQVVMDISKRLEELEQHIINNADRVNGTADADSETVVSKATAQAVADLRITFQPELDALNRAVRRYEKRTTVSALQTESRLQDLESQLRDVVVLAAAAQRNVDSQPRNFVFVFTNWFCGAIVLPIQWVSYFVSLPPKALKGLFNLGTQYLGFPKRKQSREKGPVRYNSRAKERRSRIGT